MGYSAIAIANFFIDKSLKTGIQLTDMMLQKMVFFAHAVYMKTRHEPLIDDAIIAMQHGPVIMSLYQELKSTAGTPLHSRLSWQCRPTMNGSTGSPPFRPYRRTTRSAGRFSKTHGGGFPR